MPVSLVPGAHTGLKVVGGEGLVFVPVLSVTRPTEGEPSHGGGPGSGAVAPLHP